MRWCPSLFDLQRNFLHIFSQEDLLDFGNEEYEVFFLSRAQLLSHSCYCGVCVYGVQIPASQPGAHLSPASVSFHLSLVSSFSSVPQSCPTLFDPMNCSTPGFPVHQQLLEVTQTQIHQVSDAIQPSHPVIPFSHLQSFPASRSFLMSQLFASGGQSTGASALASVLAVHIQGWFPLGLTGLISLQSKGLSRVFSNSTVQKNQFLGAQPFLLSNSHPYMTTGKTIPLTIQTFVGKYCLCFLICCLVLS